MALYTFVKAAVFCFIYVYGGCCIWQHVHLWRQLYFASYTFVEIYISDCLYIYENHCIWLHICLWKLLCLTAHMFMEAAAYTIVETPVFDCTWICRLQYLVVFTFGKTSIFGCTYIHGYSIHVLVKIIVSNCLFLLHITSTGPTSVFHFSDDSVIADLPAKLIARYSAKVSQSRSRHFTVQHFLFSWAQKMH